MLDELGTPLELCLALQVDEELLVKRLLRRQELEGRDDDNEESIRNRMAVYCRETQPLVDYYRARGQLRDVVASGTIEEVAKRIEEALS